MRNSGEVLDSSDADEMLTRRFVDQLNQLDLLKLWQWPLQAVWPDVTGSPQCTPFKIAEVSYVIGIRDYQRYQGGSTTSADVSE